MNPIGHGDNDIIFGEESLFNNVDLKNLLSEPNLRWITRWVNIGDGNHYRG